MRATETHFAAVVGSWGGVLHVLFRTKWREFVPSISVSHAGSSALTDGVFMVIIYLCV